MSEQEDAIERDGTVPMGRFQAAVVDWKSKLRTLADEAEAKRLAELRQMVSEEVERVLHPGHSIRASISRRQRPSMVTSTVACSTWLSR